MTRPSIPGADSHTRDAVAAACNCAPTATLAMLHMRTNAARGTVRHRFHQVYVKMACELVEFLEHNPGEVDVVRLNSDRWTEDHKVMMEALIEGVRIPGCGARVVNLN